MKIDGTHNEAPQCLKPMHKTVYLFKEVKLNTLTQSANAVGLQVYNSIERPMAALSHDLANVILPYDQFGLHLDVIRSLV